MKIVKVIDIEDCFDGSFIKEIVFNEPITKDFIFFIGKDENLKYYPSFAKPFFKINVPDKYEMKGVESNNTIRIILKRNIDKSLKYFVNYINKYNNTLV